ncbi:MAG: N-acetyltransferase [Succinivibrio sp.]|nr:N-acetyltransferase [Succinivibrio sp.]
MAHIRLAAVQDAQAINEIAKQYIDTPITLDYEVPSVSDKETQILAISHSYPFLIIEDETGVLGYAYAHSNLEQPGLSWNAILNAYIDLRARGRGFGLVVSRVLMEILKLQNVCNVYSIVTEGNPRSERLHKKLGFTSCGTSHKTAFKNGRWLDVTTYEYRLGSFDEPKEFVPMKRVDRAAIDEILKSANAELAEK